MKPFTFYDIYYTPFQALSDEQAGKFFRKICNCLEGKQTETDGKDTPEFELYWESIADDLESYRNSTGKSCGLDKRYRHFPFLTFYQKAFSYLSNEEGGAFVKMLCAYIFESTPLSAATLRHGQNSSLQFHISTTEYQKIYCILHGNMVGYNTQRGKFYSKIFPQGG